MNLDEVIYDGYNFLEAGLVMTLIDHLTIASRDNQIERLANRNGGVLVQSLLSTKPIHLEGYYIGTSVSDAQAMYDTLAAVLNRQERKLTVPHAGATRSYIATPENVIIKQPDGLNRLTFSFEFVVPSGRAEDELTSTLIAETTITSSNATLPLTVGGSVLARPLITVTFTSVTGGTNQTVTIRNARDFIGLTFTRNFVSGDVILIDSTNFAVYINGVLTQPNGRLPTWAAGPGSLYYSDTFTNRSVKISATYIKKNL